MDIELAQALEENKNLRDNYEQYKATAEPTIKELQQKIDSLQGYLDHDIEYDIEQENIKLKAYNEKLLNSDIEKHNKIVSLKAQIEKMKSDVKTVYLQNDFINKSPYQNMSDKLTALSELIKSWN